METREGDDRAATPWPRSDPRSPTRCASAPDRPRNRTPGRECSVGTSPRGSDSSRPASLIGAMPGLHFFLLPHLAVDEDCLALDLRSTFKVPRAQQPWTSATVHQSA